MQASQARRILVRSTNWIGDAILTMPAVQRLREAAPDAHLAMLCAAKLHDLWRHNPFLNEVIPFDPVPSSAELRAGRFDLAVLFPNSFRSAWECWRAGIPVRVGFTGHRRRWLLTHAVSEPRDEQPVHESIEVNGVRFERKRFPAPRHQVHRYLDLVGRIGANRHYVAPKIYLAHEELPPLSKFYQEDGRPLIGLNAGAEYGPAKRWLPERFAAVAGQVAQEKLCRWLLLGGPGDVAIAEALEAKLLAAGVAASSIINVAGRTSLPDLFVLLKCCRVLLTNDTGPMHVAAALNTPVVAIFGSTSPELTGPLGPHATVIRQPVECSPCFLRECPIDFRCMQRVAAAPVAEAVLKLL